MLMGALDGVQALIDAIARRVVTDRPYEIFHVEAEIEIVSGR